MPPRISRMLHLLGRRSTAGMDARYYRCASEAKSLSHLPELQKTTYPATLNARGGSLMSYVNPVSTMDPGDEVMTAPVAAALKGVHRNSVHKAIKDGSLKATRSGKTWLIPRRDLDAWQVIGHRPQRSTDAVSSSVTEPPPQLSSDPRDGA